MLKTAGDFRQAFGLRDADVIDGPGGTAGDQARHLHLTAGSEEHPVDGHHLGTTKNRPEVVRILNGIEDGIERSQGTTGKQVIDGVVGKLRHLRQKTLMFAGTTKFPQDVRRFHKYRRLPFRC